MPAAAALPFMLRNVLFMGIPAAAGLFSPHFPAFSYI